ncbi:hypothetical protein D3C72_1342210 [compost metagenome]
MQALEQPLARRAQDAAAHDRFERLQAQAVGRHIQRAAQGIERCLRRGGPQIRAEQVAAVILERADGLQVAVDVPRMAVAIVHYAGSDKRAAASSSRRGSPEASFLESDRV